MDSFYSEVRMFAFNFAPKNFKQCNGDLLPINENGALYALLGTTFGGDGRTNFAIPDLRGRVPVHRGSIHGYNAGIMYGSETVTLTWSELPNHTHILSCGNNPDSSSIIPQEQGVLCENTKNSNTAFNIGNSLTSLSSDTCSPSGQGQAHNNMMPSTVINFCMCINGVFPARN